MTTNTFPSPAVLTDADLARLLAEAGAELARRLAAGQPEAPTEAPRPTGREGFVSYRQAAALTSLSKSSLKRRVRAGNFPRPIRIGDNRVAFDAAEVRGWCERQAR